MLEIFCVRSELELPLKVAKIANILSAAFPGNMAPPCSDSLLREDTSADKAVRQV